MIDVGMEIAEICVKAGLAKSKSEARRAIENGAVRIDGLKIIDPRAHLASDGKQYWIVEHG